MLHTGSVVDTSVDGGCGCGEDKGTEGVEEPAEDNNTAVVEVELRPRVESDKWLIVECHSGGGECCVFFHISCRIACSGNFWVNGRYSDNWSRSSASAL